MVLAVVTGAPALLGVVWAVRLVRRLRRLAVRTAAARAGLRVELVRWAVAAAAAGVREADRVRAEPFWPDGVNALTAALAGLRADGPVAAELAEAQLRVALARRIYDDAVRDTRSLRSHRGVRWLRLARGPLPDYFDIADPAAVTALSELPG